MGVSNFDKQAATKRLETRYMLHNAKGAEKLLENQHRIYSTALERGDMAAIDLLTDLESAIDAAGLTDIQKRIIELRFNQDLAMKDAAKIMGVDISTASRNRKGALKKIAEVFKNWDY
ncbi:Uncharacterized protein BCRIVMBC845_06422 [Bacillus cereus]|nr:Uncharacterized protein BCRIVMBC845_06422 [Bacillus cereus]